MSIGAVIDPCFAECTAYVGQEFSYAAVACRGAGVHPGSARCGGGILQASVRTPAESAVGVEGPAGLRATAPDRTGLLPANAHTIPLPSGNGLLPAADQKSSTGNW